MGTTTTVPAESESRLASTEQVKHTPGPWSVIEDTCRVCREKGEREFIIDGPPGAYHGQFSHEPDARLIAAAPDMLEVLQTIVANARMVPDPAMNGTTDIYAVPLDDLDAARAAIAKAEGRTP